MSRSDRSSPVRQRLAPTDVASEALGDPIRLQTQLDEQRRAVDTDFFDITLRELVRMVEEDELIISPEYQRQFRWFERTQSALIESFLLGLPIPAVFVAANATATWEVVDGLQRIGTIVRFMGNAETRAKDPQTKYPLKLSELETLTSFNGLTFENLPRSIQFLLEKRFVRVQVLNDKSDSEVRYELFRRLNAGAVALSPQEVRACVYRGEFNDLVERLSADDKFKGLLKLKRSDQTNGTAEELVVKFFAYRDWADKFDGRVTHFLNEYMESRKTPRGNLLADEQSFLKAVEAVAEVVDGGPFLRPKVSTTPLNQLEPALVAAANLLKRKKKVEPLADWLLDEEFLQYSTKGTNTRNALKGRIRRAEELLSGQP